MALPSFWNIEPPTLTISLLTICCPQVNTESVRGGHRGVFQSWSHWPTNSLSQETLYRKIEGSRGCFYICLRCSEDQYLIHIPRHNITLPRTAVITGAGYSPFATQLISLVWHNDESGQLCFWCSGTWKTSADYQQRNQEMVLWGALSDIFT